MNKFFKSKLIKKLVLTVSLLLFGVNSALPTMAFGSDDITANNSGSFLSKVGFAVTGFCLGKFFSLSKSAPKKSMPLIVAPTPIITSTVIPPVVSAVSKVITSSDRSIIKSLLIGAGIVAGIGLLCWGAYKAYNYFWGKNSTPSSSFVPVTSLNSSESSSGSDTIMTASVASSSSLSVTSSPTVSSLSLSSSISSSGLNTSTVDSGTQTFVIAYKNNDVGSTFITGLPEEDNEDDDSGELKELNLSSSSVTSKIDTPSSSSESSEVSTVSSSSISSSVPSIASGEDYFKRFWGSKKSRDEEFEEWSKKRQLKSNLDSSSHKKVVALLNRMKSRPSGTSDISSSLSSVVVSISPSESDTSSTPFVPSSSSSNSFVLSNRSLSSENSPTPLFLDDDFRSVGSRLNSAEKLTLQEVREIAGRLLTIYNKLFKQIEPLEKLLANYDWSIIQEMLRNILGCILYLNDPTRDCPCYSEMQRQSLSFLPKCILIDTNLKILINNLVQSIMECKKRYDFTSTK